ncbi:MAG: hypothetical protein Ct9H300mP14_12390 [Gammaproteobacteria bacterium]|nr:MAG: hypothetical protein Ct9H300mP14_12390 [Gammaproteobacteria bacterium]
MLEAAEQEINDLLRQRHRIRPGQPDDFFVRNMPSSLKGPSQVERKCRCCLRRGRASLSGGWDWHHEYYVGLGTERTREVGLRMAVGARGRDILLQFVTEAVVVSLIGGVVGVVLGFGGSLAAAKIAGWPVITSPLSAVIAMGFAAVVGIFFGYYPALKASRLDPIAALRHE